MCNIDLKKNLSLSFFFFFSISCLASQETSWKAWYTVKINEKPYAYYQESIEVEKEKVRYQLQLWKNEKGSIDEEQLGSVSKNNESLTPLFFHLRQVQKKTPLTLEGSIDENSKLRATLKIDKNTKESIGPKFIHKKAFWSSLFPLWIFRRLEDLEKKKSLVFQAILEDSYAQKFKVEDGKVEWSKEKRKNESEIQLLVQFRNEKMFWTLDRKTGVPIQIEIPAKKQLIEKVDEKKAKSFLNTK